MIVDGYSWTFDRFQKDQIFGLPAVKILLGTLGRKTGLNENSVLIERCSLRQAMAIRWLAIVYIHMTLPARRGVRF